MCIPTLLGCCSRHFFDPPPPSTPVRIYSPLDSRLFLSAIGPSNGNQVLDLESDSELEWVTFFEIPLGAALRGHGPSSFHESKSNKPIRIISSLDIRLNSFIS